MPPWVDTLPVYSPGYTSRVGSPPSFPGYMPHCTRHGTGLCYTVHDSVVAGIEEEEGTLRRVMAGFPRRKGSSQGRNGVLLHLIPQHEALFHKKIKSSQPLRKVCGTPLKETARLRVRDRTVEEC